jgi:hypothetical protein
MAKIRTLNVPWTTVFTDSTNEFFYPATGWMAAAGVEAARGSFEVISLTGLLSVTLGYQVADVIDDPGTVSALDSSGLVARTTDGVTFGTDFDSAIGGDTKGKQLIRWGFVAKNSSGSLPSTGRVTGKFDIQVCG